MGGVERVWRSFALKVLILIAIFFAVPAILYDQFRAADAEKDRLLSESVADQGRLIAEALRPEVERVDQHSMQTIATTIAHLGSTGATIRLLYRPANAPEHASPKSFYYVASSPPVENKYLEQEREDLIAAGVLDRLNDSCDQETPLALRYTNPAGGQEILTSVTPIKARSGCWAVVISNRTQAFLGSSLGLPYWQTPAVRFAAAIYLVMALIVTVLFLQAGLSLKRFGRLARDLRTGAEQRGSFASLNRVPELSGVAAEFDRLVEALRSSSQALRFAAQETAHAFKTPLGIIAQSLEPLRARVTQDDARSRRAIELIDRSLDRLDGLVSAARRLDETIADSINPPREPVPLSDLVAEIVEEYREAHEPDGLRFATAIEPGIAVAGGAALIETVAQNLIDNAASFSPPGGEIEVQLRARDGVAELAVADRGPGVEPDRIGSVFERFISQRPEAADAGAGVARARAGQEHFGLGLWIVRRNVEAMGGVVAAENRPEGGFRVVVALPLLR
ncbi:MAG TPA: HAMP domain-containing sensor histidine kinase [Alphaproteobacteria bacterium]|nr:HAMP domain-containing sensor histidine kinase [Alphaproteobacteria bacterium]